MRHPLTSDRLQNAVELVKQMERMLIIIGRQQRGEVHASLFRGKVQPDDRSAAGVAAFVFRHHFREDQKPGVAAEKLQKILQIAADHVVLL